jgi:hypothetical protein
MRIRTAFFLLFLASTSAPAAPHIRVSANPTPRELFAEERLEQAIAGLPGDEQILLATRLDPLLKPYDKQIPDFWPDAKEAFLLRRLGNTVIVAGYDPSGVLYGAMELADRIRATHALPATLDFQDHPQLKLSLHTRGVSVVLRQSGVDEVSRHAGRRTDQHAVPLERPPIHFPAEAAEIS